MLALVYLSIIFFLGDAICRRIFTFYSIQHRLSVAFLSGLLISTCATYLIALVVAAAGDPLLWANIIFFVIATGVIIFLRQKGDCKDQPGDGSLRIILNRLKKATASVPTVETTGDASQSDNETRITFDSLDRPAGKTNWDWLFLAGCLVFGCWMLFATLDYSDGSFTFAIKSWSDFGANLSLAQSFALGHNFPTEHPFFPGESIKYHFLFWFQAANLSYLGLNLVWSVNLLSLISLASLLALIITFAELLFNSRPVGRIATILFFLASSSLSFIPFLWSQSSLSGALNSILNLTDFVKSGYPFRGDDWGALTVGVFSNQRHLISAAGILLIVLIFLVGLYRRKGAFAAIDSNIEIQTDTDEESKSLENTDSPKIRPSLSDFKTEAAGLIFCGILIGLLPYWNSAVFVSSAIVLGSLFLFFPFRRYLVVLIGTVILFGLPQILMLKSGSLAPAGATFFKWGYTIPDPTVWIIIEYIGWTFGIKWLILLVAMLIVPGAHRRFLVAISALVPVVFLFQLSTDAFNNHKLLNIWTILSSTYVAYALWFIARRSLFHGLFAVVLAFMLSFGAIIDLFPIHNDRFVIVPHKNDRLTEWLLNNTKPNDIFLTDTLLSHPILFTGRKIFLGNTLFAWTAGYELKERESTYRQMFLERDSAKLLDLLRRNNISYVAIDDGVRINNIFRDRNEYLIRKHFEKVFEDTELRHGNLVIYKVPSGEDDTLENKKEDPEISTDAENMSISLFAGEPGSKAGQFDRPRGIFVDQTGNTYVADTMNRRIQKFSEAGNFVMFIESSDGGDFELREPNGVVVDHDGNIYVADSLTHRVLKFDPLGKLIKQWTGPDPGFFGPRAVAIASNNLLYIVDQGRSRIVALDPETDAFFEWGKSGTGEGEFIEPTGLDVSSDRVYVADTGNNRIQVFDLQGKILALWPIPEWNSYPWHYPDLAISRNNETIYVTSPKNKEILVFNSEGNRMDSLRSEGLNLLDNPSSIAISFTKSGRRLYVLDTGYSKVFSLELDQN